MSKCINTCFAQQFSAYKGIKEYGERAIAAMTKELMQLDRGSVKDKPVIEAISHDIITDEDTSVEIPLFGSDIDGDIFFMILKDLPYLCTILYKS